MKTFARAITSLLLTVLACRAFASDTPELHARVNDYADLLTEDARHRLDETLASLEQSTSAQVVILTVHDMGGLDIKRFAMTVAEHAKLGQKGKDNGVLILYAATEDRYRIEVGYGLEGAIPDGKAGSIIHEQLRAKADPKTGTRDFDGAFTDAVAKISQIVATESGVSPTSTDAHPPRESDGMIIMLLIAFVITAVFGIMHILLGAAVGGIEGGLIAASQTADQTIIILCVIAGTIIGALARFIAEAMLEGGTDGDGGSFGGSSSSSSFSDSFSGGGGSFGGGGADG